jgi:prophage regulatory protein
MEPTTPPKLRARNVVSPLVLLNTSTKSHLAETYAANLTNMAGDSLPNTLGRPLKILRLQCLMERTGLKRSAVYYLMSSADPRLRDPTFPKSIKISKTAVGWIESEVETWIRSRIADSRAKQ